MMKRTIFSFSILFFGMLFPLQFLYAENVYGALTVSPAFQEIAIEQKDERKDFSVAISNNTDADVVLRISVLDFGSLDESGGVAFLGASGDLEKKYSLASWMRPEKDTLAISRGETKEFRVTIENRDALSPGGHYGALTFEVAGSDAKGFAQNSVAVKQLFSTLVFVKKVGGEIYDLKLNGQEYNNHYFIFQDIARLRFQNNGNVHLAPRGVISIIDPLGRIVAKGIINQESSLIFPETIRVYPVKLNEIAKSFIPGRYTMTIAYRYDGKDDFATSSLQFDFIPPIAIIACSALIVLFGWYVVRRWRQKGERRAFSSPNKSV